MPILDQILALIQTAGGQSVIITLVLEFVLRLVPSKQPLSVLHVAAIVLKKVGAIAVAAGDLLDKVLPQKIV